MTMIITNTGEMNEIGIRTTVLVVYGNLGELNALP